MRASLHGCGPSCNEKSRAIGLGPRPPTSLRVLPCWGTRSRRKCASSRESSLKSWAKSWRCAGKVDPTCGGKRTGLKSSLQRIVARERTTHSASCASSVLPFHASISILCGHLVVDYTGQPQGFDASAAHNSICSCSCVPIFSPLTSPRSVFP